MLPLPSARWDGPGKPPGNCLGDFGFHCGQDLFSEELRDPGLGGTQGLDLEGTGAGAVGHRDWIWIWRTHGLDLDLEDTGCWSCGMQELNLEGTGVGFGGQRDWIWILEDTEAGAVGLGDFPAPTSQQNTLVCWCLAGWKKKLPPPLKSKECVLAKKPPRGGSSFCILGR